jgi:hypothetical protein
MMNIIQLDPLIVVSEEEIRFIRSLAPDGGLSFQEAYAAARKADKEAADLLAEQCREMTA